MTRVDLGTIDRAVLLRLNKGVPGLAGGELSERVIERLILAFCTHGDTAIDCGAADGRMTRLMVSRVGAGGRVLAFEPLPEQASRLETEFASASVDLVRACVSIAPSAAASFFHARNRRWVSSLSPSGLEQYDVEELTIAVTSIDVELTSGKTAEAKGPVRLIKLDIEGAEFSAIRGARSTLLKHGPIVIFENALVGASRRFGYSKEDFFAFFEETDYRVLDIFGRTVTPDLWETCDTEFAWNFVAVRQNAMPNLESWCQLEAIQVVLELVDARKIQAQVAAAATA